MPELPEVEVVRLGLLPAMSDAVIRGVDVVDRRALTRHVGDTDSFEALLRDRRVVSVARRGKFLWMPLAGDATPEQALIAHLGMSGQLLLREVDAPRERHERVRLVIDHPMHGEVAVVFADQRTFGSLAVDSLVATLDGRAGGWGTEASSVPSQVAHIARDPLDDAFVDAAFTLEVRRRRSAIKRVLLDQTVVSGIGNIYADEALWGARVHPETPSDRLSVRAVTRLLGDVRGVLHRALAEGGTSFDAQYVNVNGQAGYFAHSLSAYGRTGLACPRCGRAIVRVAFTNRSSHFCPVCQRMRR